MFPKRLTQNLLGGGCLCRAFPKNLAQLTTGLCSSPAAWICGPSEPGALRRVPGHQSSGARKEPGFWAPLALAPFLPSKVLLGLLQPSWTRQKPGELGNKEGSV